jgi:hypothetical protein
VIQWVTEQQMCHAEVEFTSRPTWAVNAFH